MHYAHIIYLNGRLNWKNSLLTAWLFVRLREQLKNGIVEFRYIKQDGSRRMAKGTLHELLIPEDKKPKGDMSDGAAMPNYKSIPYFDLDKQDWRAFSINNCIVIYTVYQIIRR